MTLASAQKKGAVSPKCKNKKKCIAFQYNNTILNSNSIYHSTFKKLIEKNMMYMIYCKTIDTHGFVLKKV